MNFLLSLRFGNFDVSSCHWQLLDMSYLMVSVTLRNLVKAVDFQFPSAESHGEQEHGHIKTPSRGTWQRSFRLAHEGAEGEI